MGKVNVPQLEEFPQKIFLAVLMLLTFIVLAATVITRMSSMPIGDATIVALAFVTHADLATLSQASTGLKTTLLSLSFAGGVLAFYIFYITFEVMLSGNIGYYLGGKKEMKKIKELKNHYIICGSGRVGKYLGDTLKKSKKSILFVDKDEETINKRKGLGFLAINDDALEEDTLLQAGIKKAKALAAVMPNDGDNLLLILTAKELNPKIKIAARASNKIIVNKLKNAGADYVILPEVAGGIKIANALLGKDKPDNIIEY